MIPFVLVIVGFAFLVKGADILVSGASALARKLGVSSLLVGLTVVAFGTSMPELVVNVFASLKGTTNIAIGNIIGSNIANIALVLGAAAALAPLRVQRSTVWKEIPFALLAVIMVFIMTSDAVLDGSPADVLGRADGLVLLSFFVIFIYYIFGMAKNGDVEAEEGPAMSGRRMALSVAGGVIGLVIGGKLVVDGAIDLATAFGISERVIGLTVVAVGTSLPELVTSIVAAFRKQPDLSVGNIVGSNIMNVFLVLGTSASIASLPFSAAARTDALVDIGLTVLLFVFMFVGKRHTLERWQGAGFLTIYVAYMGYLALTAAI